MTMALQKFSAKRVIPVATPVLRQVRTFARPVIGIIILVIRLIISIVVNALLSKMEQIGVKELSSLKALKMIQYISREVIHRLTISLAGMFR